MTALVITVLLSLAAAVFLAWTLRFPHDLVAIPAGAAIGGLVHTATDRRSW